MGTRLVSSRTRYEFARCLLSVCAFDENAKLDLNEWQRQSHFCWKVFLFSLFLQEELFAVFVQELVWKATIQKLI